MDRETENSYAATALPSPSPFRDVSNFKTPKRPSSNPNQQSPHSQFFTASKQTPSSSFRCSRPSVSSSVRSKATARRLKAFELEQSQSSRKVQAKKEKSLQSLSKSLTVWLNFLFENPWSSGCNISDWDIGDETASVRNAVPANGKRDNCPGGGVGVDWWWRSPKRHKNLLWSASSAINRDELGSLSSRMFPGLESSLLEICSFDDLQQRMLVYLSLDSCKEIFKVMAQVTKNIDEGRLKMKAHCPLVTDVGMKARAMKVLLCYNPVWIQIGLYIIFGGDSLLPSEDSGSDIDISFLKMVIEKQFFSHAGLAKIYAYNKMVEGMYRPGYFESLGNVILKRFLLLVLMLDRVKSQTSLPLKHGIDGVDGGSPLLFTSQSYINSSNEMINDFLSSDIMHGEGNLLAHLVIIGYKVSYHQAPLIIYNFRVTDLFEDLQDGVRLCRAIYLLQHDSSVLMKLVVPPDTMKKKLANCAMAVQYLKQAGVPLYDEDGTIFVGEDVVNGDKEITISLLWKMFVHLQLPLLIDRACFIEEISKIHGVTLDHSISTNSTLLEMLLTWMQAICENYSVKIDTFSSLVDGKAIWCLIDYYFRKGLSCTCSYKDHNGTRLKESTVSATDYPDTVHIFILLQKLTTLLGNFPEVLETGDILEHNVNERSVVMLLVFLASQLLVRKNMEQLNFHKLLGCNCQIRDRRCSSSDQWPLSSKMVLTQEEMARRSKEDVGRKFKFIQAWWQGMVERTYKCDVKPSCSTATKHVIDVQRENSAKTIQSHFRRYVAYHNFMKMKTAISFLQIVIRAWLGVKRKLGHDSTRNFSSVGAQGPLGRKKLSGLFEGYVKFMVDRHGFVKLKSSAFLIQRVTRAWIRRRHSGRIMFPSQLCNSRLIIASIIVQSHVRRWLAERRIYRQRHLIVVIQCHWRGWTARRNFLFQKEAIVKIQSSLRCLKFWKEYQSYNVAAIKIQRLVRLQLSKHKLLGSSSNHASVHDECILSTSTGCSQSSETETLICYVKKLQRWWRRILFFTRRRNAAIIIQSCTRGWIARQQTARERYRVVVIQSYWKGYLARKKSEGKITDLCLRVKKSATNVDDSMRLINRLLAAVSELLSLKSVSGILHTCATLDATTKYSQICCERLVAAGSVDTLLTLIRSVSRSIPDQEVLKHSLSTLRNLARYPHLVDVLVDCRGSIQTIFLEFLRNKECYFIASELLKKICSNEKGAKAACGMPAFLKRLHGHADGLARKVKKEKRNARRATVKETTERRLQEAKEILKLLSNH